MNALQQQVEILSNIEEAIHFNLLTDEEQEVIAQDVKNGKSQGSLGNLTWALTTDTTDSHQLVKIGGLIEDDVTSGHYPIWTLSFERKEEEMNMEAVLEMNYDNLDSIVFDGYYLKDEDGETLHPHTAETSSLYKEGLEACGDLKDEDFYTGISFKDGKAFAEIDRLEYTDYLLMSFIPYQAIIGDLEEIKVNQLDIGKDDEIIQKFNELIQFIEETKGNS